MKKLVIILIVLAAAGGGIWWFFFQSKASAQTSQTTTAPVARGPLRVSVSSTGRVVSNLDVDIKCKSSGEIIKLPFDVSNVVKKDDLLLQLDSNDEQRTLLQAQVQLDSSQAKLKIAQEALVVAQQTLDTDTRKAQSTLKSCQVNYNDANDKALRMKELLTKQLASQEDYDDAANAFAQADTQLLTAQVKLDELKTQERSLEQLRQQIKLAQAQVDNDTIAVTIQQRSVEDCRVVSPMDAVVTASNVQIGVIIASGISNVGGGTTVLTLSDLSRIFVLASVDESDIGRVRLNQNVQITADALPGRTFTGKVVRIAPRGVNVSNVVTFEVKIEVLGEEVRKGKSTAASQAATTGKAGSTQPAAGSSPSTGHGGGGATASTQPAKGATTTISLAEIRASGDSELMPEMTTNVEIIIDERASTLMVPVEALSKGKPTVTVLKSDGKTEERQVKTGITDGVNTEILDGLSEGEIVQIRKGSADSKFSAGGQRSGGTTGGMPGMGGGGVRRV